VDLRALAGTLVTARVEGMWACRANVNHGMCGYRAIKSDIVVPMRCFSCWKTKIMRPSMERGSSLQILGRIPRIRNEGTLEEIRRGRKKKSVRRYPTRAEYWCTVCMYEVKWVHAGCIGVLGVFRSSYYFK
jgi:hypothetical protein